MMQLEHVVSQTQQRPFHFNFSGAAEKEAAKSHVFLDHGENALGLDTAVHTNQFSFFCIDPFFHLSPLPGKALGHVDDLASLCQRLLASTGADALLFQRATGTVLAAVNGGLHFKTALRFVLLYTVKGDGFSIGTNVSIRIGIINHVFTAADV